MCRVSIKTVLTFRFLFLFFIREEERARKKSNAAEVLAPSAPSNGMADFYTGGGKRSYSANVDARNMLAEAFINRNATVPIQSFPHYHMGNHVASYHDAEEYPTIRKRRSHSRSRRCRYYLSDSTDSFDSPDKEKKRRKHYKDDRKYNASPSKNEHNEIVNLD